MRRMLWACALLLCVAASLPGRAAGEPASPPPQGGPGGAPTPGSSAEAPAPAAPDEEDYEPTPSPRGDGARLAWRAWSPAVLQVARDLDRPLLLFLTNPWNTVGSLMDATTFVDPRVVGILREKFVPVRVDVDRRPDVEERFGALSLPGVAVVMPSGESMYLKTPRGNYMRAATGALTAEEMTHWLLSVSEYFLDNRQVIDLRIADIVQRFKRAEKHESMPLDASVLETVAVALREQFDHTHGGWGLVPKAADPQALRLCWHLLRSRADAEARDMGLKTLRAILDSPIYDRVEGGVFRVAQKRDWSVPRREKVLDLNARLLEAMADGALASGEAWLRDAVRVQAQFLIDTFGHPDGGFKRAQGPGDPEGSYFNLGRRERRKAAPPPIEQTRIVSWNAYASSALLRAWQATGEEKYLEKALKTIEFLVERCRAGGRGMGHFFDGRAQMAGLFVDQVAVSRALLDAHQVTGHQRYLREAVELLAVIEAGFRDPESPRFIDRVPDPRLTGAMTRPDRDLVDNSEMAMVLQDLAVLTGGEEEAARARAILEMYADEVGIYGVYAAPLARAADRAMRTPVRLVLKTGGEPERARELARAAARLAHPRLIVDWVEGRLNSRVGDLEEAEVLRLAPGAAAVLAAAGKRSALLRTPEDLERAITGFPPEKLPPAAPRPAPPAGGAANARERDAVEIPAGEEPQAPPSPQAAPAPKPSRPRG